MKALAVVFACLVFGACAKHKHSSSASSSSDSSSSEIDQITVVPNHYGVSDEQIMEIVNALEYVYRVEKSDLAAELKPLVAEIMDMDAFVDVWKFSEGPHYPIAGTKYMLDLTINKEKYVRVRGPGVPAPSKKNH